MDIKIFIPHIINCAPGTAHHECSQCKKC